jgi:hypothetical protein
VAVVVDTNVAMVASGLHDGADDGCIDACIKRLSAIQNAGGLLVDNQLLILHEYTRKLGHSGQPGAGHAFVKWAHDHQAIPASVRQVPITRISDHTWRQYEEFPDCPELAAFDRSDQKFVAVALASGNSPAILNAVDSDWWNHRTALQDAGVTPEFLCPQHAPPA